MSEESHYTKFIDEEETYGQNISTGNNPPASDVTNNVENNGNAYMPPQYPSAGVQVSQTYYGPASHNYYVPPPSDQYYPQASATTANVGYGVTAVNNVSATPPVAYSNIYVRDQNDDSSAALLLFVVGFCIPVLWPICFILTRKNTIGSQARIFGNIACILFTIALILSLISMTVSIATSAYRYHHRTN
jgi:hypothetical protein